MRMELSRSAKICRILPKVCNNGIIFFLSYNGSVTRKFGSMDGDGFYWNEEEEGSYSPLGTLWSQGLVFVGRCLIDNRRTKIVTIPVELLRPLLIQTVV